MDFFVTEENVKEFVEYRFLRKYNNLDDFDDLWEKYKQVKEFKINENVFEKNNDYSDKIHFILRMASQYFLNKTFECLKIDQVDPNTTENLAEGNIGSTGRIIKMWTGADTHDDRELMSGRFHTPVRLARFPNTISDQTLINPIIKEVDLTAVCSHHAAPFSTKFSKNSKVIISYVPDKFTLGISKLQRLVRYVGQRGWLQEDLTKAIYEEIAKAAETDSIYVKLKNVKHSCEFLRGAVSESDGFTTEYYGGLFKTNPAILETVRNY